MGLRAKPVMGILILLASACGEQDPAFTEQTEVSVSKEQDATAVDSLPPESDNTPAILAGMTDNGSDDGDDGGGDLTGDGGDVADGGGQDASTDLVDGADDDGDSGDIDGGDLADGGDADGGDADGGDADDGGEDAMSDAGGEDALSDAGGEDAMSDGDGDGDADGGSDGMADDSGDSGDGGDSGDDGADDGADGGGDDGPSYVSYEQQIVQQGPGKVDVLWVVDSSGSMSEEQAYLGDNFNAFITEIAALGIDFQTAVTSTDVCEDTVPDDLALRACPLNYGGNAATRLRGAALPP